MGLFAFDRTSAIGLGCSADARRGPEYPGALAAFRAIPDAGRTPFPVPFERRGFAGSAGPRLECQGQRRTLSGGHRIGPGAQRLRRRHSTNIVNLCCSDALRAESDLTAAFGSETIGRRRMRSRRPERDAIWRRGGDAMKAMADLMRDGRLKLHIDKTFPLADAVQAHRYLESRESIGKLILMP